MDYLYEKIVFFVFITQSELCDHLLCIIYFYCNVVICMEISFTF